MTVKHYLSLGMCVRFTLFFASHTRNMIHIENHKDDARNDSSVSRFDPSIASLAACCYMQHVTCFQFARLPL